MPEVEIISLLEEQIPQYRLRADTLTQFQGKLALFCLHETKGDETRVCSRARARERDLNFKVDPSEGLPSRSQDISEFNTLELTFLFAMKVKRSADSEIYRFVFKFDRVIFHVELIGRNDKGPTI